MKLFLIDGSAILYRSFYGIAPLKTSFGQPTNAILGFLRSIKKVLKDFKPDNLLVAWDSQISNRKTKYPEYKSNRLKMPDELISQKNLIEEILYSINIAQTTKQGFEADDILFSMSQKFLEQNPLSEVIIVTSDKDLLQLVNSNIFVFDPFKNKLFDEKAVVDVFGFGPKKINLYHSLLGDSSDNIPGVSGIGKESAKKLTLIYKSLDDLYLKIESVEPKLQKKLVSGKDDAFLSQSLFTLNHIDYSNFDIQSTNLKISNWESARDLLERLELKSLLPSKAKLSLEDEFYEEKVLCDKLNLKIIKTENDLDSFLQEVKSSNYFSFDLETTGLNWLEDKILGIAFCLPGEKTFYIPINNKSDEINFSKDSVFEKLKSIFQDLKIIKIAHNIKFDSHFLSSQAGIKIYGKSFDTAIAARLSLPEWIKVGLKSLSQSHLNLKRASFSDLAKEFGINFENIPLEKIAKYAALDAFQTLELYKIFSEKLSLNPSLLNNFETIEMPLSFVLLQMEEDGILFDSSKAEMLNDAVGLELEKVVGKILGFLESLDISLEHKDLLKNINLNSPKQLQTLLFDILKLPVPKIAGSKKMSTNVETLNQLTLIHPIPALILEHRQLYKLKSTYLEGLPPHRNKTTNAIHTNYSQLIVSTGRLSSLDPNLQNIPQACGKINIRSCFISRPGFYFMSADYSQIELKVLAYLSKDKTLISAFKNNEDIHNKTACTIFKKIQPDILPEERSLAKKINFSVLYGLSAFSLSLELKISVKTAQEYINAFFDTYPSVRPWMNELIKTATENGFITTISGRQRWFNNLSDSNILVAKSEHRAAINAVIQGSAADIVKLAMIKISSFCSKLEEDLKVKMLLSVHDEILFEIHGKENKELHSKLTKIMETVVDLGFPLTVNTKSGDSWGTLT